MKEDRGTTLAYRRVLPGVYQCFGSFFLGVGGAPWAQPAWALTHLPLVIKAPLHPSLLLLLVIAAADAAADADSTAAEAAANLMCPQSTHNKTVMCCVPCVSMPLVLNGTTMALPAYINATGPLLITTTAA